MGGGVGMGAGTSAETIGRCRAVMRESVGSDPGDALLLSGGLDTSIIAHVASRVARPRCYTVAFTGGPAPDVGFARAVAARLGLKWTLLRLTPEALHERLPEVVSALRTFDPMEVRNSVVAYHGLAAAREDGLSKVMTGDGADELFAGYSFSFNLPPRRLLKRLRELRKIMQFSSIPMARVLGISASLPYLGGEVVSFAEGLRPEELVGERGGTRYGKLILRLAYEETLGRRVAWRTKTPIEYGSGTTVLPGYFSGKVSDESFELGRRAAAAEGVRIRDKEHLAYYGLYRQRFPPPSEEAETALRCPECRGDVRRGSRFCVRCGAYPISPAPSEERRKRDIVAG